MSNQFQWVDFYQELADILLTYKEDRASLIEKVKAVYANTQINMPTLEKGNQIVDMDPFTLFGLFNKSSMKESNRIRIITEVKKLFSVKADVPASFASIPVLNNQNATFYYFIDKRGENDIDDLWSLFDSALDYAKKPIKENRQMVSKYFDVVINRKGNGTSKITMGLYWIAPYAFQNLDSRNQWYIYESGKIPEEVVSTLPKMNDKVSAEVYFDVVEKLRNYLKSESSELKDFKELSFAAWTYSKQVNEEAKAGKSGASTRSLKGDGLADEDVDPQRYWIYAPGDGAVKWDQFYEQGVMGIGWSKIGDLMEYETRDEMTKAMKDKINPDMAFRNSSLATWQFVHEMKEGDIVFAKRGVHELVGRGIVCSEYYYDPQIDQQYPNLRKVRWTHKGQWEHPGSAVTKTLTDITPYTDYVVQLNALFSSGDEEEEVEEVQKPVTEYTKEQFLSKVYMDEQTYDTLVELVKYKMNVILQGAPGVGKTYCAKRLAYSMMGEKDHSRVMMVQFHQSYTYEDFIEGFRPKEDTNGFRIRKGPFYEFCKKAKEDHERDYFFIIDEINRGNLSKIFGELFVLIEKDKRNNDLQLLYSNEKFCVPDNVYIIGMMNTADRSLALMDYALRRRFAFFTISPGFQSEGFRKYVESLQDDRFNRLIACVEDLNTAITNDPSLGDGFCIGHSYFCDLKSVTERCLTNIIEYEIIPLLKEYWYDDPGKVREWTDRLRWAISQ